MVGFGISKWYFSTKTASFLIKIPNMIATYEYLQEQHDEVIYNLHFKCGGKAHKVIPYRSLDIEQARMPHSSNN